MYVCEWFYLKYSPWIQFLHNVWQRNFSRTYTLTHAYIKLTLAYICMYVHVCLYVCIYWIVSRWFMSFILLKIYAAYDKTAAAIKYKKRRKARKNNNINHNNNNTKSDNNFKPTREVQAGARCQSGRVNVINDGTCLVEIHTYIYVFLHISHMLEKKKMKMKMMKKKKRKILHAYIHTHAFMQILWSKCVFALYLLA